jgi:hypothetical protein
VCPEGDLSEFKKQLGSAHIEAHDEFTGGDLYAHLTHALNGLEKASAYLASKGIPGCYTKDAFMTEMGRKDPQVFTVWDMSELKILQAVLEPSDLIAQEESQPEPDDDPDMSW